MKIAAMCCLLGMASAAFAQTGEDAGNLPPGFYVRAACVKPDKSAIGRPPVSTDREEVLAYNFRIRRFNKEHGAFNDCIKVYTEKADRDIDGILGVVNNQVAEAESSTAPPPPAPGNMPANFYPRSSCVGPNRDMLGNQPPPSDIEAMKAYNARVALLNDRIRIFADCLKTYQDRAKRDIEQIRAATRDAAADARAP